MCDFEVRLRGVAYLNKKTHVGLRGLYTLSMITLDTARRDDIMLVTGVTMQYLCIVSAMCEIMTHLFSKNKIK